MGCHLHVQILTSWGAAVVSMVTLDMKQGFKEIYTL